VWNSTQAGEQLFQYFRRKHQGIAAGQQDVAYLRRALEVLDLHLEFLAIKGLAGVADNARACAVTAVGCALGRDQHQHPVGVAVDEPGHGRVTVLGKRVFHHGGEGLHLFRQRDDLFANRVVRVLRVDQGNKVRRNVDAEQAARVEGLAF
jgi:hypothetical protein